VRWRHRSAYPILLFLGALDAAGYSVIAPVSPQIAEAEGIGAGLIGLLVATFPLAMVGGFAVAGRVVKRSRPEFLLVISLAIVALGAVGFVLGDGLAFYFPSRFLMGFGSGGLWIGVTFSTLERWPGQEYLCMSRVFSAYSVGGLIGPGLGALGGVANPFLAYLALVGVGIVLALCLGKSPQRRSFRSDRTALRLSGFWIASAGVLFVYLGYGIVEGILPLHLSAGLSQAAIGATYAGMSVIVAMASAVAGRFGPRTMVVASVLLVVAGLTAAGIADVVALWVVALAVAGIGFGIGNTGSVGILLDAVPTERIVTAMVIWSQLGIVGYLLGPLAGGAVAEYFGFGGLGLVPVVGGAVVLALLVHRRADGRSKAIH
jgi:MFS family permease